MNGDQTTTPRDGPTLEYAAVPGRGGGGGAWSIVGFGLALAGFCYVGWIAGRVWWYVNKGMPVEVILNREWFVLPVLGAGVSLVGVWRGRRRWVAACGILLGIVSVVTLFLLAGRWG